MPKLKVQASDGKFLTIPVDSSTDPSQYDSIIEDALTHYNGGIQQQANPQESLGSMAISSAKKAMEAPGKVLAPVVQAGKLSYNGYAQIADVLTNPNNPLYTQTLASLAHYALGGNTQPGGIGSPLTASQEKGAIMDIPTAAGVPNNPIGAALSTLAVAPMATKGINTLGEMVPGAVGEAMQSVGTGQGALESGGQGAANWILRRGRMPGPQADLATDNLGQFLSSDINDVKAGQKLYKDAANSLGVKHIDDTLGEYGAASSEYPKAIKDFSSDKGIDVLKEGINSSYQDLHNVVEATTEMRMRPSLYQDLGTMKDLPRNRAIALDMMKRDALDLIQQKAEAELADEVGRTGEIVPEEGQIQAKLDAYKAAMQLPQIRKDLVIAHAASNSDALLGSNLGGRTSELGTLETVGGMMSGNPALAAYGATRSPMLGKALIGLGYHGYQFANPQLAADAYNLFKGNQNGQP